MTIPLSWDQWPEIGTKIFKLFRSEVGEELVLDKNIFVERILFTDPIKPMDVETKNKYLDPFKEIIVKNIKNNETLKKFSKIISNRGLSL